ncbi:DUF3188 domain-containing protein [Halolamina sp. CBA1230]|uniref:DUF3188 domain-containing protein n=1 Tax=Halolamina sp. CBA1230 TaxID=1853690 RepID=UPI00117ABBE0|nr:DUF3188 domain-containing protein [Halolamina sp. CBA1230]QKY18850.1 DUF3188 domain-containing protein [Halolamina sp. CBA1230]
MSSDGKVPEFTRQELREADTFVEGDYSGVNPRGFYRKLKRRLEEVQTDFGFKYHIQGHQDTDLTIDKESVGQKTGTITGRLKAYSDWEPLGFSTLTYRPYAGYGIISILLGVIFLLQISNSLPIGFLGLVLIGAGIYGYMQTKRGEFPITERSEIRVLLSGEVSERKVTDDGVEKTNMHSEMSVVFAGETFVRVDTAQLRDLHWALRRELVEEVKRWNNDIAQDPNNRVEVSSGLIWHLRGVVDRSLKDHRDEIDRIQGRWWNAGFEERIAFNEKVKEQLTQENREKVETHEENVILELEDLAEDLDIFIEREGYDEVENIQRDQERNPELESGDR